MTLAEIKKRIRAYRDFYGGDIPNAEEVNHIKSKKAAYHFLEKHRELMEDTLRDAHAHLNAFEKELGL